MGRGILFFQLSSLLLDQKISPFSIIRYTSKFVLLKSQLSNQIKFFPWKLYKILFLL